MYKGKRTPENLAKSESTKKCGWKYGGKYKGGHGDSVWADFCSIPLILAPPDSKEPAATWQQWEGKKQTLHAFHMNRIILGNIPEEWGKKHEKKKDEI